MKSQEKGGSGSADPEGRGTGSGTGSKPPAGLCGACVHRQLISSARSTYVRCRLADRDSGFARYPRLPVVTCRGYLPENEGD
jgi:hypothetical protein